MRYTSLFLIDFFFALRFWFWFSRVSGVWPFAFFLRTSLGSGWLSFGIRVAPIVWYWGQGLLFGRYAADWDYGFSAAASLPLFPVPCSPASVDPLSNTVVRFELRDLIAHLFQPLSDLVGLNSCGIEIHGDATGAVADTDGTHSRQRVQLPLDFLLIMLIIQIAQREIGACL